MRRRSRWGALLLVLLAPSAVGCRYVSAVGRGASAFVSSPRKVAQSRRPVAPDARLAVVWVGHATALVQIDDKVILTDPVFTTSVGQLSHRVVEPGIDPKDLPPIDAAIVSHMHQDHLSLGSLELIESRVRTLLLPSGGTAYLTDGFSFPAYELPAWRAWEKDGLRVTAVPVAHVGWRYGIDDDWMKQSFTGYVVEYKGIKVYFGGDSAYDQKVFVETSERFPNLDLALLPIAPIEPRDLMRKTHMDPAEALQAFVDLGALRMVPIHYDTFVNSIDKPGDALRELTAAEKQVNLAPRQVTPLAIGERRILLKAGENPVPLSSLLAGSAPSAESTAPSSASPPANDDDD